MKPLRFILEKDLDIATELVINRNYKKGNSSILVFSFSEKYDLYISEVFF